jgi:tryptophan-rich sensory protein
MDLTALLKTIGLCLISIIIEAVSTTKDGKQWFENLQQPKYSFPFSVWYVVGGLYYLICGVIAYRTFHASTDIFPLPIILLALMMIINGSTNFILFKFYSLKMFYWILYPFILVLIWLMATLFQNDKISFWFASLYLLWLCYDLYYFRELWKRNEFENMKTQP